MSAGAGEPAGFEPMIFASSECALFLVVDREGVANAQAFIAHEQAAGYLRYIADQWDPSGDRDAIAERDARIADLKSDLAASAAEIHRLRDLCAKVVYRLSDEDGEPVSIATEPAGDEYQPAQCVRRRDHLEFDLTSAFDDETWEALNEVEYQFTDSLHGTPTGVEPSVAS